MSERLLKEILHEVKELNHRIGNVENEISNVKYELINVKGDLNDVKSELNDVKGDLNDVKSELNDVKGDLNDVKSELSNIESQLNENTEITKAILHRQDETDAKLDHLTIDVHKLHGEVTQLKEDYQTLYKGQAEIIDEIKDIKSHLKFNTQKITETELELFKLKNQ